MMLILLLFFTGLALSAFFSGAETGFYRVTRARLLIDALTGDWIARGLLWTTNHPSVFVATALVGNNLANYLSSLGVVMGTRLLYAGESQTAEMVAPLVLAPIVFIYGELLPKNLFYAAPNALLRRASPGLLVAGVLFAPVTAILWLFNRFLQLVVRQSPQVIELVLARRELAQLITEGREVGILQPAQQSLVQQTFALAGEPIRNFVTPAGRFANATTRMSPNEVLLLARRQGRALIPVEEPSGQRRVLGYVRAVELALGTTDQLPPLKQLVQLSAKQNYLAALTKLLEADQGLGHVVDANGKTLGYVTARDLTTALLRET